MKTKIVVGSRGSKLALLQTNMVIKKLKELTQNTEFEIKIIKTKGDKILDKSLSKIGGKGLFIEEIEHNLISQEIDLAVHSMKDVQNLVSPKFAIFTALNREDPRDVLITRNNIKLSELPKGSVIGTSSLRRIVQLRELRSDLQFKPLRGNVDTRISKLEAGEVDAILLAAAGLNRMGLKDKISEYLELSNCIPSVGQGALCIEIRSKDIEIRELVKGLVREEELKCVFAERAFLREMDGGCTIAIGAHAELLDGNIKLEGFVCDENNEVIFREAVQGSLDSYEHIGIELGRKLKLKRDGRI